MKTLKKILFSTLIGVLILSHTSVLAAAIEFSSTPLFSDPDLVAYYKLEDATDEIGTNDLTNNGSTPFNAALFNNGADGEAKGSGNYLDTGTNFTAAYDTPTSWFGWVKVITEGQAELGLDTYTFRANPGRGWHMRYENNGGNPRIHFRLDTSGSDAQSENHSITLGTTDWHLLGFTSDGTTLINYVDGVAVSAGITLSGTMNVTQPTAIGDGVMTSAGGAFHDDYFVFKRVLTPTEVASIYSGNFPAARKKPGIIMFN